MTRRGAQQFAWRYTCSGCCKLIDDRVVQTSLLDTGVVCPATLHNGIVKRWRTCFLHTFVVSSYTRCVASCVTYYMSMTHPIIPVFGSQRGKKKCTDDYTRGRPAGLNHNSKGSTSDFFVPQKCFWTSSDPRTGWKKMYGVRWEDVFIWSCEHLRYVMTWSLRALQVMN